MAKKKILIVDDEPDILRLASLRLKKLGYDVIKAVNGKEALDIMRDEKPDLVLLDPILPVMNGADVCKKTKNDDKLKHIPIILFTTHSDTMTAEKAKSFVADSYIIKPFDLEELVDKIENVLAQGAVQ